jgi:hypothetical protein
MRRVLTRLVPMAVVFVAACNPMESQEPNDEQPSVFEDWEEVTATATCGESGNCEAIAQCPAGKRAISGGFAIGGGSWIVQGMNSSGNGWRVSFTPIVASPPSATHTARAYCIDERS